VVAELARVQIFADVLNSGEFSDRQEFLAHPYDRRVAVWGRTFIYRRTRYKIE